MIDTIKYYYYWALLHLAHILRGFFFTKIIPVSVLQNDISPKIGEMAGIHVTTNPEEKGDYNYKKYKAQLIVKDPRFWIGLATYGPNLMLGEAYMNDWIDFHGDAYDFVVALLPRFNRKKEILGELNESYELSRNQHSIQDSYKVIEKHYNIGNDLFQAMLDKAMLYSCAYWKEGTKTLTEAQINKMDLIARKLKLKPGMTVLEIGCGFGGMAKFLATNYQVKVVCYNISKEQIIYAKENCKGLDVEIRSEDYRNATGQYDRVYSIELFEHVGVKQLRDYFEVVECCLKEDGLHLLQTTTCPDQLHFRTMPWISKYIFPGVQLPYLGDFAQYSAGLLTVEDIHNFGYHYKLTLLEWHKNFVQAWPQLQPKYGSMMDGKFFRAWEFYLLSSAAFFNNRNLILCQVVLSKKGFRGGYDSVR